ncbi:choice-of-anchor E domain-containing protein [Pseudoduganella sp. FT55W]|uniref:Choice-of-anchor E domain-containing protein n=1 Tax=Duganella rivi TaxID=2666083 RepID=A0A7X4GNS6_9BURK|nr:choice-of-anchor E domain-containing protein [Duganella rivi]MYM66331.1 choice-of-anchor E domain-containing protein [Duganella rivi]
MNLKKLSQVLLVASSFVAASASAAVVTVSIPFATNVIDIQDTNWTDFLHFAKFDSSLGALQSVKLDLYSDVYGELDLTNYNGVTTPVGIDLGATIAIQRDATNNLVLLNAPLFTGTVSLAANGGAYSANNSYTAHETVSYSDASTLGLFSALGGGTLTTVIKAEGSTLANATGVDTTFLTQAGGRGYVTYSYIAAVPEPETYGMLLLGLGMMGVIAKRKQRSAKA